MLAEHTFRPLLHVCRNGQKVAVALEELGLPYEAHTIDIRKRE
jgi:glutathione S-transferase